MKIIDIDKIESWYAANFENRLKGRRIVFEDIEPLLKSIPANFEKEIAGVSEEGISIYKLKIGNGAKKVMIWSQMHGNESTGTKAVFDLFKFLIESEGLDDVKNSILNNCTLLFVPMLNPDGSHRFTRVNSNEVDLNRDAVDRTAKESILLRSLLDDFNPHFCFNLHDQRTIFNVEGTKNPATISFLAPSEDVERNLTKGRIETMSAIVAMNSLVSQIIPDHIGRYTDEFYPTATGDNFQKLGHNTILIEAGHYYDDYERDTVRKFNFYALLQGLLYIATEDDYSKDYKPYFDIPNNDKKCYDIIYRNVKSKGGVADVAFQYDYVVKDNSLVFVEEEAARGDLKAYYGHKEYDMQNKELKK
ncbi:M14 family zinc carboxypeptidase [Flavicella marina]|uniref:M14 family zinc carboxypeptidase n=1 Tax=Flavicella marina TaxID=1475951 RepID=UPI0012648259|nr:M14 family zinc carboxypeptidase [Flavicella marina]